MTSDAHHAMDPRARVLDIEPAIDRDCTLQIRAHRGVMAFLIASVDGEDTISGVVDETRRFDIQDWWTGARGAPLVLADQITGSRISFARAGDTIAVQVLHAVGSRVSDVVVPAAQVARLLWWMYTAGEVLDEGDAAAMWGEVARPPRPQA